MKTRFCPSPTGHIHLGNMRTALFNVLLAKKTGSTFLLRIEDTDQSRSKAEFADALMEDLHWLSSSWDEGPRVDGEAGPYWQSQRQSFYDQYYEKLIEQDKAYSCFCSDEQLALNRKIQRASGQPPRYPGTCRHLPNDEVAQRLAAGEEATLRFRVPNDGEVLFEDVVRGHLKFPCHDIGDFIIRRADGTASFMYCNALDDALMGVTHVLRGEDHLTNTPRQLMILQALGLHLPIYAHIALLLGPDGSPLSKRNGSRSVRDLRDAGYMPLAMINYMARLGHYYADDSFMNMEQLAEKFDVKHLVKAPARYDAKQLERWQKEAVMHAESETLWQWLPEDVRTQVPDADTAAFIDAIKANISFPEDATRWCEAIYAEHLEHSHENKEVLKQAGVEFFEQAMLTLAETETDFKALCNSLKAKCDVKGKALFLPLRIALTGEAQGPEMHKLLPLMGVELAKRRFEYALFHI